MSVPIVNKHGFRSENNRVELSMIVTRLCFRKVDLGV